jgi:hypothetical protein
MVVHARASVDKEDLPRKLRAPVKYRFSNQLAMHARQECQTRSGALARLAHEDLPTQTR